MGAARIPDGSKSINTLARRLLTLVAQEQPGCDRRVGEDRRLGGAQYATVTTSTNCFSSSDKRVHFGLGGGAIAPTLEIR
jgi:hypothetical protein